MVSSTRLENYAVSDDGEEGPKDRGNVVFCLVMIVGFGVLMPWNMFITIAPDYFEKYWFKQNDTATWYSNEFMSALAIASQLPNALINIINLFLIIGGPLIYRVLAPVLFNLINVSAVLALVIFVNPTPEGMAWFFWTMLAIIMSINFSNGLYENSIFGVFADFPHKYTSALLIGNNVCGLLITILTLAITLIANNVPQLTAIIYFSISLAILVICGFALFLITKQDFYHYHHEKGIEVRKKADTHKPSLTILWTTFKGCYVQIFNIWFSFAVTLTMFPAMMSQIKPSGSGYLEKYLSNNDNIYTLITTYLVFNLFSTIGAILSSKFQKPGPKYLIYFVIARAFFIPLFFFCNYRSESREIPVYFKSSDIFVPAGILMSLSHGYLSSLAMGYTPKAVSSHLSRFAAQLSACTLMVGLLTGAIFSSLVGQIIKQ
ncbi:unnamed protein product [Caenorhabditis angaria]|uniref:Equilibrative nucleoside transporter 3 n=1 Tax=Caenorhabditis angaria TaxID=860376 RepID=A0A9P1N904_9PELO|nr:unnamed protein product [Caenorhabditis angaria]